MEKLQTGHSHTFALLHWWRAYSVLLNALLLKLMQSIQQVSKPLYNYAAVMLRSSKETSLMKMSMHWQLDQQQVKQGQWKALSLKSGASFTAE